MAGDRRQIKLCAFPHAGPLAWRQPDCVAEAALDITVYRELAQTLERGKFDALFLADNLSLDQFGAGGELAHRTGNAFNFEPFTLLGALSSVTEHLGLMATASTTYNHPFHIARKFASLDHLSGGRAGWNVVTSMAEMEAVNFGLTDRMGNEERYARANAFVESVFALWESWHPDAVQADRASGMFFDPSKIRPIGYYNDHFSIAGPLNISRPPQGRPVICQAGTSQAGLDLAARTADLVFVNGHSLAESQTIYAAMKARAERFGRRADELLVLPGLFFVVGGTEAEARRKLASARDAVDSSTAKKFLSQFLPDIDLDSLDYDAPIPDTAEIAEAARKTGLRLQQAERRLTIRELCSSHGNHWRHLEIVGTPQQIAAMIETWLLRDAADGFNLFTLSLPSGFNDFVDSVVPELQRRGIFRTEYTGTTLRENLGLSSPEPRWP